MNGAVEESLFDREGLGWMAFVVRGMTYHREEKFDECCWVDLYSKGKRDLMLEIRWKTHDIAGGGANDGESVYQQKDNKIQLV